MAVPDHPRENRRFTQGAPDVDSLERAPLDTMPAGSFTSSNVHSGLYDFGERDLFMRYKRDGADAIYRYWDVPAQVWNGLVAADSKGSYVNQYIATDYRYSLAGRDEFPARGAISNGLLRQFLHTP